MSNVFDMFSMKDKVVVITGGAGFLGRQYAEALSQAGACVVLWDRNLIENSLRVLRVDITNANQVREASRTTISIYHHIDVLINNAGMNPKVGDPNAEKMTAPYEDYPLELWNEEIAVDLTGAQLCTQAVVPHMIKQGSGAIVNIASEVANIAVDNRIYGDDKCKSIAYITCKTAILGLTRAWAAHLGKHGIRVNAFSPGGMPQSSVPQDFRDKYSSLNMLGRMAEEGDYNAAMLFLCSDASKFMTGTNLIMDGGKHAWCAAPFEE